jgi:hypothetical protein
MSEFETIRTVAKKTLAIPNSGQSSDYSLWDHSQRLVRNVEYICQLPEIKNSSLDIDKSSLIIATYFCQAGLAHQYKNKNSASKSRTISANTGNTLELCSAIIEKKLSPILEKTQINKISKIITESGSHLTNITEAMILSDARNLDDMGATGIFNEFKRHIIQGKGVTDALQSWKKKIDYRYWQARLKESFRFEPVRKLAQQRLSATEYFMNQLKIDHSAKDLEELSA